MGSASSSIAKGCHELRPSGIFLRIHRGVAISGAFLHDCAKPLSPVPVTFPGVSWICEPAVDAEKQKGHGLGRGFGEELL